MKVKVHPSVTSGWHGIDVFPAEQFLFPKKLRACKQCGGPIPNERNMKARFCSKSCYSKWYNASNKKAVGE